MTFRFNNTDNNLMTYPRINLKTISVNLGPGASKYVSASVIDDVILSPAI